MMRRTIITMIRMMTMARIAEDRWALTSCLINDDGGGGEDDEYISVEDCDDDDDHDYDDEDEHNGHKRGGQTCLD